MSFINYKGLNLKLQYQQAIFTIIILRFVVVIRSLSHQFITLFNDEIKYVPTFLKRIQAQFIRRRFISPL